jgi:arylsulfatase A-like enzyme
MVSWINNFSHSTNAIPEKTNERVATFLHQLEETGAFNTTFIIFLIDNGMRWGNIRKTAIGWYEERIPFIQVWVPEWFKKTSGELQQSENQQ